MKNIVGFFLITACLFVTVTVVQADTETDQKVQDLKNSITKLNTLVKEGKWRAALKENGWVVEYLKQLDFQGTKIFFRKIFGGFTRQKITFQNAMGINVIDVIYEADDHKKIKITYTEMGGSSPMGAFGAMAKFGMMGAGVNKFRTKSGLTGMDLSKETNVDMMVNLDAGMLKFESRTASKKKVRALIDDFPLGDFNRHLKGE